MTTQFTDIRARLEAVASVDWDDVGQEVYTEYCTDWHRVGPVLIATTFSSALQDRAWPKDMAAVAEFVQHAAEDIRRLLAEVDAR